MAEFMEDNAKEKEKSLLELSVRDFRAIKEATIKLDGITVVAGENSTGKSTLSTLFYYIVKISREYNDFLKKDLNDKMQDIRMILGDLSNFRFAFRRRINGIQDKDEMLSTITKVQEYYKGEIQEDHKEEIFYAQNVIMSNFRDYISDTDTDTVSKIFDALQKIVKKIYEEFQEKVDERSKNLFENKVRNIYNEKLEDFSVKEYGKHIISKEDTILREFAVISHAIYIDSPMAVENPEYTYGWRNRDIEIEHFYHWKDLDFYLKRKNISQIEKIRDTETYNELQRIFMSPDILDGEIILDEQNGELMFYRNGNDRPFRVATCATGIKSLAILQMLYKNGWLTNKTLLVLDEPEAHLHPKWVVEYARLVVLLNKKVGVKFFISSHHPDMVSAIKYITNKEGVGDTCRFYLEEKQGNDRYTFIDRGRDIEKIFGSFNDAMNRIRSYGANDERDM